MKLFIFVGLKSKGFINYMGLAVLGEGFGISCNPHYYIGVPVSFFSFSICY